MKKNKRIYIAMASAQDTITTIAHLEFRHGSNLFEEDGRVGDPLSLGASPSLRASTERVCSQPKSSVIYSVGGDKKSFAVFEGKHTEGLFAAQELRHLLGGGHQEELRCL